MTKILILILSLFLVAGCSKEEEKVAPPTEFYPTYRSIDIKPGTMFDNVIANFGEANATRTEPSSYVDSDATIYEYDYFEIETYYDGNVEKVYSIRVTSEEQPTNEGVRIGDTKEKMISVYGNEYQSVENILYFYTMQNSSISFTLENDIIVQIVYYMS